MVASWFLGWVFDGSRSHLSSSALGDNLLRFFQVPGIISLRYIESHQRDIDYSSYKLDNVSANLYRRTSHQ